VAEATIRTVESQMLLWEIDADGRRFSEVQIRKTARRAISSGPALHRGPCRSCSPSDTHPEGQEAISCTLLNSRKRNFPGAQTSAVSWILKDSEAHRGPRILCLHRQRLGFFVTGGFFSPPLGLISAR
jgi:hypothetical protein